jgi:hypothetical protein
VGGFPNRVSETRGLSTNYGTSVPTWITLSRRRHPFAATASSPEWRIWAPTIVRARQAQRATLADKHRDGCVFVGY